MSTTATLFERLNLTPRLPLWNYIHSGCTSTVVSSRTLRDYSLLFRPIIISNTARWANSKYTICKSYVCTSYAFVHHHHIIKMYIQWFPAGGSQRQFRWRHGSKWGRPLGAKIQNIFATFFFSYCLDVFTQNTSQWSEYIAVYSYKTWIYQFFQFKLKFKCQNKTNRF